MAARRTHRDARAPDHSKVPAMTIALLNPLDAAPVRETWADVMRLLGMAPESLDRVAGRVPVATRRVRASTPLFVEGTPADAVYLGRHGTFKVVAMDCDGYEQVLDFLGRGDLIGGDGLGGRAHSGSAIAIEDSSAWVLPLRDLNALRRSLPAFDEAFARALSQQLLHAREMADLMGAVAAEARVARFLMHQAARMERRGESARRLRLRMGRRDIGSYLGLAHETISRSMTLLARWGCIRVDNREVEILDSEALGACAGSTRRRWMPADDRRLVA
jgi:CRP/FNR family transcriptional regulator